MLKTISAALLAVSVLAAPALAASQGKTADAPVIQGKTANAPVIQGKTANAPVIKAEQVKQAKQVKPSVLNANAKMGHHHRHFRHHRSHKHMGALKTHQFSKVAIKHVVPAKRG
jgi:hypothetical protein